MEWPYRRFVKAWEAFQRRLLCEEWRQRKIGHISACWSNTNLDDPKNDRTKVIKDLEQNYDDLIAAIWNGPEEEEEVAFDDPFFAAGKRNAAIATQALTLPGEEVISALPA